MPDNSPCASYTQGFLAYSNIDLVPNGFITRIQNDRRGQPTRLLPSSRISVELQYSIRSDISGTSLNNLSPGGNTGFILGSLGAGAGFAIGAALGCSLLGDIEPTKSRFIFHICESESLLNKEIVLTQQMIDSGLIDLPNYVIAVLGVTRAQVTFTEDEIASLGAGSGITRGAHVSQEGQIEKDFTNFKYGDTSQNLFRGIAYDDRRLLFRADNQDTDTNCFVSSNEDDITTKRITVQTTFTPAPGQPPPTTPIPPLHPGDKLYICYLGASRRVLRHAMFASSFFFLFPGFLVERIGQDRVLAWNFRPYSFKVHKHQLEIDPNTNQPFRGTLLDLKNDKNLETQIAAVQNNTSLSEEEKTREITALESRKVLDLIEGQRLVEVLHDTKNQRPYIRGFYFADTRGILLYDMESIGPPQLLLPKAAIPDQDWFNAFLARFNDGGPGFNEAGELDPANEAVQSRLLKGFYFDVSDHVNMACTDNEKYGYQKDFAEAIKAATGNIGIPNLDLVKNNLSGRNDYDLMSAVFQSFKMSSKETGAYFIRDCNKIFTYDQQFCSSGTVQADMFIRTPFFYDSLSTKARVYIERFTPQFGINPDGNIWVTTTAVGAADVMTSHVHPGEHTASLVFGDSKSSSLNYHLFEFSQIQEDFESLNSETLSADKNHDNPTIDNIQESALRGLGYDKLIGNRPGYSRGMEITTDVAKTLKNILKDSEIYTTETAQFSVDATTGDIIVRGLDSRQMKRMEITYDARGIAEPGSTLAIIFPGNQWVIDNIPFAPTIGDPTLIIDMAYYYDDTIRITGPGLTKVLISKIEITYISSDAYEASKVSTSVASTVFDRSGKWYVFYEDNKATDGAKSSVQTDPDGSALQSSEFTEISCLISPDLGKTWYDHKGIVRTSGTETIRTPYAIINRSTDDIHLFFALNDCLMHKKFGATMFDPNDAFKAYQRPSAFTDKTSDDFGIDHFSDEGKRLRKIESYVIVGLYDKTVQDNYLATEVRFSEARRKSGNSCRISVSGDTLAVNSGFTESNYVAVIDPKRYLKVFFSRDGKLYCLGSGDGDFWSSIFEEGINIHKATDAQEPRPVSNLGITSSDKTDLIYMTYLSDDMMFVREFHGNAFDAEEDITQITNLVDPTKDSYESTFLVGQISDELKMAIKTDTTKVRFYYGNENLDQFNEKMAISSIGSTSFTCGSGLARVFYKDSSNYIRGISFSPSKPVLDTKLGAN